MLKALRNLFLRGIAVLLPTVLTIYLLWWLAARAEELLRPVYKRLLGPDYYVPGLGVATGIVLVVIAGLLTRMWLVSHLFERGEEFLSHMPLVKTIFNPLKDMMRFFTDDRQHQLNRVVMMNWNDKQVVGFITRDNVCLDGTGESRVAVYFPMSYQIGGYTLLVRREEVHDVDMTVEEGMRFAITAGLASKSGELPPQQPPAPGGGAPPPGATPPREGQ